MKNNLAKNTMILSFCTILNKGLLFFMVPLFSRWLTIAEYGAYDVYATYITLLIPIITLACSDAIFRLSVDKDKIEDKKYYITNGFGIVLFNIIVAIILLVIYGSIKNWNVTLPFILLLIGEVFDNYFQGFLRAIKKLNIYAISKTISVITTALMVTIFVRFLNMGLNGIMYGYAVGFCISVLFSILITNWVRYLDFKNIKLKGIKELLLYSYPLIPNSISWWFINVSDRTIINIFLGNVANGVYGIACKIPNLCSAVFSMFSISWQEAATEMVNSKERNKYFVDIYNKTIKVLLTLCSGIIACNFLFFEFIFDIKYYDGHMYAAILVTSIIFSSLSQFLGGIQISLKNPKANGISTVIGAIVNVIVHLALIKFINLYAAAISTVLSNVIVCIIRIVQLKNDIEFKFNIENYFYIVFFVYFCIMSVLNINLIFDFINLMIASIVFVYGNKEFMIKILNKIIKKKVIKEI